MVVKVKESGLDYEPVTVGDLFDSNVYYTVPKYQRGYSWGVEEVRELLKDITEAKDDYPDEAYLLGQIIVCPSTNPLLGVSRQVTQFDLIDGQQRSTTLYLIVLTALKLLESSSDKDQSMASRRRWSEWEILKSIPSETKEGVLHPRIRVAANGEEFTLRLLAGQELINPVGPTQTKIQSAVEEIETHLGSFSVDQIRTFLEFLLSHVWLVRLSLTSSAHALRVFQKVNNRGLELDDADLIKNYLFQTVSDEEFAYISDKWETATNTLFSARLKRVKSMEFLMKAQIGIKTGVSVPTGGLYEKWSELLKTESQVRELAEELPENAKRLVRISKGQLPRSGTKTDLTTGTSMTGWIQQFEVQLAGSNLEEKRYSQLIRMVEDRAMISNWAKEPSQKFEAIIHPWANSIKSLGENPSEAEVWQASEIAIKDFDDLAERAYLGIRKLNYEVASHRDRLRYVLARVNKRLQSHVHVTTYSMSDLMQTTRGDSLGYDLDHVFPKAASQRSLWKQSTLKDNRLGNSDRYAQSIHSIGNLILLHPEDNRQQSDALPWDEEKLGNLAKSELYLNQLLVRNEGWVDSSSRRDEYLARLQREYLAFADDWSEESIDARAEMYWNVLLEDIRSNFGL